MLDRFSLKSFFCRVTVNFLIANATGLKIFFPNFMQLWFQPTFVAMDKDFIELILFALICILIFAGLARIGYRRWRLRFGASRWIPAGATIQGEYASLLKGGRGRDIWHAVLQYSYQVAGESYPGYLVLGRWFNSAEDASAAARPWLLRKISVRYNPRRPHESVYLRSDGAPAWSRSMSHQPPVSRGVITLFK